MALPNPNMSSTPLQPFDPLPAATLNEMMTNIDALAAGTGLNDNSVTPRALGDSGWIDVPVAPGFAALNDSEKPRVRKIGSVVYARGGFSSTGISASGSYTVATLPAGFYPNENLISRAGTSTGNSDSCLFITSTGDVQLRVSSTVSPYYKFGGQSWLVN